RRPIDQTVRYNEREGKYLGKTVQVIPHVTDEVQYRIHLVAEQSKADVVITEIGGTTGDIEGLPFLEAIREFALEAGHGNVVFMHVTFVPFIKAAGELKTKPTQQSVAKLREIGIAPHILICRCERPLDKELRQKISLFCNVPYDAVIECGVEIVKVDAEDIEREGPEKILKGLGGILVPGGFGERGIEGKITAAKFARENKVPYLGLCLGMQIATIEFARNVLKLEKAHSTEFAPDTPHPVICLLDEQKKVTQKGGTMRLGAQPCPLV